MDFFLAAEPAGICVSPVEFYQSLELTTHYDTTTVCLR